LRREGQPTRQPLHSSDALRAGSHGVPNVRSSPRVHGSWHPSPAPAPPGRCGLHGGPRRATRRLRRVVAAVASPPSCPTVGALAQGGVGCPAPLPRVAGRPFRTPFKTAGKKCVSKCATQFLLIGGKRRSTPHTTTYSPGSSISGQHPSHPGRFKGPVGSPLIAPTFALEAAASRSRPRRIGCFRRRAILRRFVPHPRKMANMRRLVLAKASHTRPNRRGRLVPPTAASASSVQVSTNASPVRPFQAPEERTRLRLEAAWRRSVLAGRKGTCQAPPSVRAQNSAPTAVGACYARRWRGTPLASLARQPFRRAHRSTGACIRFATPVPAPAKKRKARCRARATLRGLRTYPRPSIRHDLRSQVDTLFTATRIECHLCFHGQLFNYPGYARLDNLHVPAQAPLHALARQTGVRCSIHPVRGAYALISPRMDSTPPRLCAPDTGA